MPPLKSSEHLQLDNNDSVTVANQLQTTGGPQQQTAADRRAYSNSQYAQKLLRNLNKLREDASFCDVDIIAGNTVLSAHRAVLSASSAYFEAMFRPELGMSERTQKSVTLHSIAPEILKLLIDFVYTGRLEITQVNFSIPFPMIENKFLNKLLVFRQTSKNY